MGNFLYGQNEGNGDTKLGRFRHIVFETCFGPDKVGIIKNLVKYLDNCYQTVALPDNDLRGPELLPFGKKWSKVDEYGKEQRYDESLSRTEFLELRANPITDDGFKTIATLADIEFLKSVDLRETQITGASIELLTERWKKNKLRYGPPAIYDLKFDFSPIGDAGLVYLGEVIPIFNSLRELTLSFTGLTHEGLRVLVDSFAQRNDHLCRLDISENPIGNEGGPAIRDLISKTVCLTSLNFQNTEITDLKYRKDIAIAIAKSFSFFYVESSQGNDDEVDKVIEAIVETMWTSKFHSKEEGMEKIKIEANTYRTTVYQYLAGGLGGIDITWIPKWMGKYNGKYPWLRTGMLAGRDLAAEAAYDEQVRKMRMIGRCEKCAGRGCAKCLMTGKA